MCLKDYFFQAKHTLIVQSKKGGFFRVEFLDEKHRNFFFAGHIYGNIFCCLSIMVLGEPIFSAVVISRNFRDFLPEFAFLFFGRNFDDSGFIDDSGCTLTFLHDTDNPGLVSFLFLNVLIKNFRLIFHQKFIKCIFC